jgi:deoxyribodipyrimidine photo-lyase
MSVMEQNLYGCRIGIDYPLPIVDHQTNYQAARQRIHAVKRSKAAKTASATILQKHGSRRSSARRAGSRKNVKRSE